LLNISLENVGQTKTDLVFRLTPGKAPTMMKFVLYASSIGVILGHVDGLKLAKNVSASKLNLNFAYW
jgi:hypothetical protein